MLWKFSVNNFLKFSTFDAHNNFNLIYLFFVLTDIVLPRGVPSVQDVKEEVREMSTKNLKHADVQCQTLKSSIHVIFVYNKLWFLFPFSHIICACIKMLTIYSYKYSLVITCKKKSIWNIMNYFTWKKRLYEKYRKPHLHYLWMVFTQHTCTCLYSCTRVNTRRYGFLILNVIFSCYVLIYSLCGKILRNA